MTNFENTFIRSASPQFSEDGNSESATATLPIGDRNNVERCHQSFVFNNNKTGYQPVNNDHMPRGRNTFAFWTLIILLFILAIGNLALTSTILGVLKLGRGMQNLELVPEAETIKFFGVTDLDRIYKKDGIIEGFAEDSMTITGDSSTVSINLLNRNGHVHNKLLMNKNGTVFKSLNQFEIKNPISGETIFSSQKPHYILSKSVNNLYTKSVSASKITSPIDEALKLQTKGKIILQGAEGTFMESKEILWSADQNIFLKSLNGSVVLSGIDGIYIDMKNIPIVQAEHGIRTENIQYKLCVCMPQGKLFKVAVQRSHNNKGSCSHFNVRHDPCI